MGTNKRLALVSWSDFIKAVAVNVEYATLILDITISLLGLSNWLYYYILSISPSLQQGGVYLVEFLNVYGPGLAILFVVFIESAGVFWFYGVDNFSNDIKQMLGHRPGIFWRFCWKYVSPAFLLVVCIFSFLGHEDMLNPDFKYPSWTVPLGLVLTASSVLCIPAYIIYKFFITSGGPYRVSTEIGGIKR